jgi:hypothetical protein
MLASQTSLPGPPDPDRLQHDDLGREPAMPQTVSG